MLTNPQRHFAKLPDPRRTTRNKLHKLEDIVMITLCAVLCGHEDWVSIEDFASVQESWLRGFLELPNGIPSHDTLSDVMGCIDKEAFGEAFADWVSDSSTTVFCARSTDREGLAVLWRALAPIAALLCESGAHLPKVQRRGFQ